MLRQIEDENGNLTYTTENIYTDDTYKCWKFKECKNLKDYLQRYMNQYDLEESGYQYVYDESEDWLKDNWDSGDIERAFIAGAKWMKMILDLDA